MRLWGDPMVERIPPGEPIRFTERRVEGPLVSLGYAIGELDFTETVRFDRDLPDTEAVRDAVHILHLVAGVSYAKLVAPAPLVMPPLTPAQRRLVERLYDDGLREFAYRNGIDVPLPVEIDAEDRPDPAALPAPAEGSVIPIGGGKDSALVASLIDDGVLFAVNAKGAQDQLASALGRDLVGATRTLDPLLFDLNAAGAPNGHVPVTAITSAISVLAALALGRGEVIMGIERSADEPTVVTDAGVEVNHQFSKSNEAERLLRDVFAPVGIRYFSLLRSMTELAIGAGVALRGLAGDIVSCNRVFTIEATTEASRIQRPCGNCAKCLFTALMLAPFLDPDDVEDHFGGPLLDRVDHIEDVRALWSEEKPFDCVGERLETAASIRMLSEAAGWRNQAVVVALADEADAMLRHAGVEPSDLLAAGSLDGLPETHRPALAALLDELGISR